MALGATTLAIRVSLINDLPFQDDNYLNKFFFSQFVASTKD